MDSKEAWETVKESGLIHAFSDKGKFAVDPSATGTLSLNMRRRELSIVKHFMFKRNPKSWIPFEKSWFSHARVGLYRRYRVRHLLWLCCTVCVILCLQLHTYLYEYIYICAWCGAETEGSGFGLEWSIMVLGQYNHFASLLVMVSAPVASLCHAPCPIGAAKQICVWLSLTALPSSVQFQAHRELGDGEPCSCIAKEV